MSEAMNYCRNGTRACIVVGQHDRCGYPQPAPHSEDRIEEAAREKKLLKLVDWILDGPLCGLAQHTSRTDDEILRKLQRLYDDGKKDGAEEERARFATAEIHKHRWITDDDGAVWPCECGAPWPGLAKAYP